MGYGLLFKGFDLGGCVVRQLLGLRTEEIPLFAKKLSLTERTGLLEKLAAYQREWSVETTLQPRIFPSTKGLGFVASYLGT